ncbi:Replication protein A 70 kDa DNA-binding subunit E [Linum perenne]
MLAVAPSNVVRAIGSPTPDFPLTAFEYVEFEDLPSRESPCPHLSDVIGRPISISVPNHITATSTNTIMAVQEVVLVNKRGLTFPVTLWADFTRILDAPALMARDRTSPVIISLGALRVATFNGVLSGYSTAATRVVVDPLNGIADSLRTSFESSAGTLKCIPALFETAEQKATDVLHSFRTVLELNELYAISADVETRYRCKAIIVDIDTIQHWHYRGCKECYRSVAINDDKYWCAVHHDLTEMDTHACYRIKLMVEDHSGLANFILLGRSADLILPITAAQLARAYPNEDGTLPPPIEALLQATATFEVRLARNSRPNVLGEFQVSRVWDLQPSPTATKLPPLVSLSVPCRPTLPPTTPKKHV